MTLQDLWNSNFLMQEALDSKEYTISSNQAKFILGIRILIVAASCILLLCTCFNIYTYLFLKRRYKDTSDLLFYINAVIIIIAIGFNRAVYDVPNENICLLAWITIGKIPLFFNYNLGICQASTLTKLVIKLRHLFALKKDTHSLEAHEIEDAEEKRIKLANR